MPPPDKTCRDESHHRWAHDACAICERECDPAKQRVEIATYVVPTEEEWQAWRRLQEIEHGLPPPTPSHDGDCLKFQESQVILYRKLQARCEAAERDRDRARAELRKVQAALADEIEEARDVAERADMAEA